MIGKLFGKKQQGMINDIDPGCFERDLVIGSLARIRSEWEEATDESLMNAQTSVGLLLGDITLQLELSSEEQRMVLGDQLRHDFFNLIRNF